MAKLRFWLCLNQSRLHSPHPHPPAPPHPSPRICTLALLTTVAIGVLAFPQSIEFFPKYGHLLLSGSADTKVKLWDVYNRRNVKRTYFGHGAAVRHVNFNDDGSQFLSSSWDRHVKLWDTETGKCIHSFTCGKVPYQSKFRPGDNNSFLSACSSKEVVQYDIRERKQEFTYDYHLGAVNTITFVGEDARRFITSSVRAALPALAPPRCSCCTHQLRRVWTLRTTRRCWCGSGTPMCR